MNRRNVLLTAAPHATTRPSAPRRPQIIASDGAHLFHRDWGEGRPVVFVHGWALNSEAWAYQAADLSDQGLRCIAYDRRGHGRSDDPGRGYDLDSLADDLHAVMETLDLRDAVLVSHSFGAKEAVRYLTRHGEARVARLVFIAPAMPYLVKTADNPYGAPLDYFAGVEAAWRSDFPRWVDDNTAPYVTPQTSQGLIDWTKRQMLQASLRAVVDVGRVNVHADLRNELTRIRLPTLVIQGTRDASAPLEITGRRVAALIPGAELKVYEDAPHGLYMIHMERLNADLLAFARA